MKEKPIKKFSLALAIYQMVSSPYREGSTSEYKNGLEKFNEVITKFHEPHQEKSLYCTRVTFISG